MLGLGLELLKIQRINLIKYLLDVYKNSIGAYSTRLLRKDYKDFALRLRRSSDNAERSIPFTKKGLLDEDAIYEFLSPWEDFPVDPGAYSLDFGGKFESVKFENLFEPAAVGISCWVNFQQTGSFQQVRFWQGPATGGNAIQYLQRNSSTQLQLGDGTSFRNFNFAAGLLDFDNTWKHLVVTIDEATQLGRCWVNGVESTSGAILARALNFEIDTVGAPDYTVECQFQICEFAVFEKYLTDNDVASLYNQGFGANVNYLLLTPYVYLRLNETTGDVAIDSSGNGRHGTLTNFDIFQPSDLSPFTTRNVLEFRDGVHWVSYDDVSFVTGNEMTISYWIDQGTTAENLGPVANKDSGSHWVRHYQTGNNIQLTLNGVQATFSFIGLLDHTVWQHVVITVDSSGNARCYLDGVESVTGAIAVNLNNAYFNTLQNYNNARLGDEDPHLAEVVIAHDYATPAMVASMYNSGTPTDYTAILDNIDVYFKLDDVGSPLIANDYSGNNNHGVLQNYTQLWQSAPFADRTVLRFDGVDSEVQFSGRHLDENSPFTISFWFKQGSIPIFPTNIPHLIKLKSSTSSREFRVFLANGGTYGAISFGFEGAAQSLRQRITLPVGGDGWSDSELGVWHHLVIVSDGTAFTKAILDGVDTPLNNAGALATFASTDNVLGQIAIGNSSYPADGYIAEVAVKNNYQATVEQAQAIYNSGNPVDVNSVLGATDFYFKLNETGGSIAYDVGGVYNGTLVNFNTEDAYVVLWYDQSGQEYDLYNYTTTSQPQLVSAGVIITHEGKPAVDFSRNNTIKLLGDPNSNFDDISNTSYFFVGNMTSMDVNDSIFWHSYNSDGQKLYLNAVSSTALRFARALATFTSVNLAASVNKPYIIGAYIDGNTELGLKINHTFDTSTVADQSPATPHEGFHLGDVPVVGGTQSFIHEFIMYPTSQKNNIVGISALMNSYYGFYPEDELLLLDLLSVDVGFAWSPWQLSASAPLCCRIRRSGDNAELDIGFENGFMDTKAIEDHIGSNVGYLVTVYDQSGNGINFSESTTSYQHIYAPSGGQGGLPTFVAQNGGNTFRVKYDDPSNGTGIPITPYTTSPGLGGIVWYKMASVGGGIERIAFFEDIITAPADYHYQVFAHIDLIEHEINSVEGLKYANNFPTTGNFDFHSAYWNILDLSLPTSFSNTWWNGLQLSDKDGVDHSLGTFWENFNSLMRNNNNDAASEHYGQLVFEGELTGADRQIIDNFNATKFGYAPNYGPLNYLDAQPEFLWAVHKMMGGSQYCIRIRRDSDNAEQDIGWDANGYIDTAAITTFLAGANGYVHTYYDQSGNQNHAVDATVANQALYSETGGIDGQVGFFPSGNGASAYNFTTNLGVLTKVTAAIAVNVSIAGISYFFHTQANRGWIYHITTSGFGSFPSNTSSAADAGVPTTGVDYLAMVIANDLDVQIITNNDSVDRTFPDTNHASVDGLIDSTNSTLPFSFALIIGEAVSATDKQRIIDAYNTKFNKSITP